MKFILILSLLLTIYLVQGVIIGLILAIPLYLDSRGADWKKQADFNFVVYPFSLKLAWAPIVDAFYIARFGRRKTWILPLQILLGLTLFFVSFQLSTWIEEMQLKWLTWTCFFIYFLLATQDIAVDGWALTLLSNMNLQWASTCQTVGQTAGRFIGFTVLTTLESANFTNQFLREPLSMPMTSVGLFTVDQFVRFWAVVSLIVSIFIVLCPNDESPTRELSVKETYLSIIKLFKKGCVRQLAFLFLISPIGYAPTYAMTNLVLKKYGLSKETIGLLGIPLIIVKITIPFCVTNTQRPLTWYSYAYLPRLFIGVFIAIFIWFIPTMINSWYFYPLLILLFMINEAVIYLMLVSRVGFYARISDPTIGGTYITLLSMLGNLGASMSSSIVLYAAHPIGPSTISYPILVGICFLLGSLWLLAQYRTMFRLQKLPVEKWHLLERKTESAIENCLE